MANSQNRQKAERFGHKGEFWAKLYLRAQGFRILGQRVKSRNGEIDIVVKRGQLLVFIEVKARAYNKMLEQAFEGVRQDRIVGAAQYWLSQNPKFAHYTIRFDVIGLAPFRWPVHIVDAFQTN
ncbi:YraN family protein [Maritalea sp.]|uniref:YraN family protein n=1 Tax=Maritalea sp. TaxID=2003361 RepID=UPI003EF7F93A